MLFCSHDPGLEEGQYLLVNKIVYFHLGPTGKPNDWRRLLPFGSVEPGESVFPVRDPQRGDVIIFHYPRDVSRDFVKRIIGLPGETVEIQRGQVIVNGSDVEEPYLISRDKRSMSLLTVEPDAFFVLGDNRRASNDSRDWGTVPTKLIVGRAWVSYWPLGQLHSLLAFPIAF